MELGQVLLFSNNRLTSPAACTGCCSIIVTIVTGCDEWHQLISGSDPGATSFPSTSSLQAARQRSESQRSAVPERPGCVSHIISIHIDTMRRISLVASLDSSVFQTDFFSPRRLEPCEFSLHRQTRECMFMTASHCNAHAARPFRVFFGRVLDAPATKEAPGPAPAGQRQPSSGAYSSHHCFFPRRVGFLSACVAL